MVLMAIILNVNSLGDKEKWVQLWKTTPRTDIICFQETHLCTSLEFTFKLHAQGYNFYFSHGSSALAGVCMAICRSLGVTAVKLADIPSHCLPLELTNNGEMVQILNIYAPNDGCERVKFFQNLEPYLIGNVMLLGDFNSATLPQDHLSKRLDTSSILLDSILRNHQFTEPVGSHLENFTYHHPSIPECKSRLDRIYVNYLCVRLWGFSSHVSFSDHYLVGLCLLKPVDLGPKPWRFPSDLLEDEAYCAQVKLILSSFDKKDPMAS